METDVNPTTIKTFYAFWQEVTGYGNDLSAQGKRALSPAKEELAVIASKTVYQDAWQLPR